MKPLIRPNILRMQPYPAGKPIEEVQRELGLTEVVKIASNENPLGPSPMAVEAMKRAVSGVNFYPDASGYLLKQKLASRFGVDVSQVMIGNGSDEIIGVIGLMFLEPGTEMLMGEPSFLRYGAAAVLGDSGLVRVPLDPQLRHDLPAMAKAVTDRTRLVFIANPNNPTGTIVSRQVLQSFVRDLPTGVTVVLDEAYHEYACQDPDYPDGLDLLREGLPVVVLRTFSKAYGLAGIRVGYGFASSEVVQSFNAARNPFDVNAVAQAGAMAALDDEAHLERTRSANKTGLARLMSGLTAMGYQPVPSHANFVCVDLHRDSAALYGELLKKGVIVRPGTQLGLPSYLRISVGTERETDLFLQALGEVCAQEVVA